VKKIAFVSESIFESLLNGGSLAAEIEKGVLMQEGSVLISREKFAIFSSDFRKETSVPEQRKKTGKADSGAFGERSLIETKLIWQRIKRPRVTIDRENSASTLYFLDEVRFAPYCGLWFGVKWLEDSDESRDKFDGILTELSCAGWGGKRSIGLGNYNYAPEPPITLPDAETSAAVPWVSLSRYLPAVDEIPALSDSHSAYALDRVGGWLSPEGKAVERRRNLNLIREGSVLAPGRKAVYGSMADVQPDYQGNRPVGHPVWRNGYALAVGYPALAEKGTENDKI
jgi:CRISPR-associated protein Csm4